MAVPFHDGRSKYIEWKVNVYVAPRSHSYRSDDAAARRAARAAGASHSSRSWPSAGGASPFGVDMNVSAEVRSGSAMCGASAPPSAPNE